MEAKMNMFEEYIRKQSQTDPAAAAIMTRCKLNRDVTQQKVTSVVKDNLVLRDYVNDAFKQVNELKCENLK